MPRLERRFRAYSRANYKFAFQYYFSPGGKHIWNSLFLPIKLKQVSLGGALLKNPEFFSKYEFWNSLEVWESYSRILVISFNGSLHFCLTTSLKEIPQLSSRQSDEMKINSSEIEPSTLYIFTRLPYLRVVTAFFSFYWLLVCTIAIPFSLYTFFKIVRTSFSQFFSLALLAIASLLMLF